MSNSPQKDQLIRYHVLVSGKVQGVGYRMSVLQAAQKLSLNGWVRNLSDGRVEAVFEGNISDTKQMVDWCRQGNKMAVVEDIASKQETPEGIQGFEISR
ncbi:MAG: acylphosphatase [Chroococcus sp. CMT-3BRIN-NPC107]|jgi:acylphosphatase|nr:acylphosphatase [Chroococcus sp. CMT-3BRIN-NPC107]